MVSLRGMVAVVGGVIVVAAIGMIGNSFSISVAERTRQFGLLSSLGASKRQLKEQCSWRPWQLASWACRWGLRQDWPGCSNAQQLSAGV